MFFTMDLNCYVVSHSCDQWGDFRGWCIKGLIAFSFPEDGVNVSINIYYTLFEKVFN